MFVRLSKVNLRNSDYYYEKKHSLLSFYWLSQVGKRFSIFVTFCRLRSFSMTRLMSSVFISEFHHLVFEKLKEGKSGS